VSGLVANYIGFVILIVSLVLNYIGYVIWFVQ